MTIPKRVKIGGIVYEVRIAEDWPGREGSDGMCFYDHTIGNVIFIGAELSKEAQEITLLHEALHAMNSTMNHEFLDSLAEQLYQFFSDNQLLTTQ